MKFLIVSQYFYPENFRINDFALSLVKKGHSVTVITGLPNYPKGKLFGDFKLFLSEDYKGIKIYRVPLIPRGNASSIRLVLNYLSFLVSSIIFSPFMLLNQKFDIIFSTNYSPATVGITGVFLAKIKNAKNALWVQDLWPQSLEATGAITSKSVIKLVDRMMHWIYLRNDFIFSQSRSFLDSIRSYGVQEDKLFYLPNWAEDVFINKKDDSQGVAANNIDNDKFTLMFAGNLGEAQSLETILDALTLLNEEDLQVLILGEGRKQNWIKGRIKELKLEGKIKMLGSYPLKDMPAFFRKADFMLVTLKKDDIFASTIPGKIQSYLLSGKPIISALDGEGARVISESGSGFNCNSEDYHSLAKNIRRAIKLSNTEKKEMGDNGREYYYRNFDREKLINNFINTLSSQ